MGEREAFQISPHPHPHPAYGLAPFFIHIKKIILKYVTEFLNLKKKKKCLGRGERGRGGGNYGKSKPRVEQRQLVRWGRGHRGSIPWKFSLREIHAGPGRRKKNSVVPSSACCARNRFGYELFPTLDRH